MLGLADAPLVPGFGGAFGAAVLPPPPRPALPPFRGTGGGGAGAALTVAQVLSALGPDRPPRHQQLLTARSGDCVGVDDAQVHPRDPARVRPGPVRVGRDRNFRGHVHVQPPGVEP
jgi:hypothetical protein